MAEALQTFAISLSISFKVFEIHFAFLAEVLVVSSMSLWTLSVTYDQLGCLSS